MRLDLKDRKLLYWLDQDSRQTSKELARKVRLSEQAVGYRLRRFEHEKAIKAYIAFINLLALGYRHYKVLLRLRDTDEEKEREIVAWLRAHPSIHWLASCSGHFDLHTTIIARDSAQAIAIIESFEREFGTYIAERVVNELVSAPGFTRGYLIGQKSLAVMEYGGGAQASIDKTDSRILKALSQRARCSLVELAAGLDLSVDIVRYRMRRLAQGGVIAGYTVFLDHGRLGIERYSVLLSLRNMGKGAERRMTEFARQHRNIVFITRLLGGHDMTLELEVESRDVLEKTLREFRKEFAEHIKDFEILLVTEEIKNDFYPFDS